MPELPEVETIVRVLEKSLMNDTIKAITLYYKPLLETQSEFAVDALCGSQFVGFTRRGKYLCFEMSNGLYWVVHLRMEGKFHLYDKPHRINQHTHLLIQTDKREIHYLDTRKFSRMAVVSDLQQYLKTKNLGYEPFDENLSAQYLYDKITPSKRVIKNILLDQSIIAGIGNIYADEILYQVMIHPVTPGTHISMIQCVAILEATRNVLKAAILQGGTTIRSYTSSLNVTGLFQVRLNTYGQEGKACPRCGSSMKRIVISGRSSVFCAKCQKVKQ